VGGEFLDGAVQERPRHDHVDPAVEVAGDVRHRLPFAEPDDEEDEDVL
jgi:hypothetical protein